MLNEKSTVWILIASILGLSFLGSSFIVSRAIVDVRAGGKSLYVKGSAKESIKSDFALWSGTFNVADRDRQTAYRRLQDDTVAVVAFLEGKGYPAAEATLSSVSTTPVYVILENGMYSNRIESYVLSRSVEIESTDVDKIAELARVSTELINLGVNFESSPPSYFYTKLAEKKIDMIERATADAKARAEGILNATGGKVGDLVSASVGVFQITPLYSNEISDGGINDTASIQKEITAVVNCYFDIAR